MIVFLIAIFWLLVSSCAVFLFKRKGASFFIASNAIGAVLALVVSLYVLISGDKLIFNLPWQLPLFSFKCELDRLSALFSLLISAISPLLAIYGSSYLKHIKKEEELKSSFCFFNILVASMLTLLIARNSLFFLLAWEGMSFASFFLLTFESEKVQVRRAGFYYLLATQIGTSFLLVFFLLLGRGENILDFPDKITPISTGVLILALLGFGTKAGFFPLHVWLPEAHPAAPSHVSAIMSGAMIKMGIYGILRVLTFTEPTLFLGALLIVIGLITALFGILFASQEGDIKRCLAYSSIENIGVIGVGIGLGVLGGAMHNSLISLLGFSGALLHVLNHGFAKTILFLGAGAILQKTNTRLLDQLGGLFSKMKKTAVAFLFASLMLSALFPLGCFFSEFLLYRGGLQGIISVPQYLFLFIVLITALASLGTLATATFTKCFGIAFLGESRSEAAQIATEVDKKMWIPMLIICIYSIVLLAFTPSLILIFASAMPNFFDPISVIVVKKIMQIILLISIAFIVLAFILYFLRYHLLRKRDISFGPTWDCGYLKTTPKMQYNGTSFVQPLREIFKTFLQIRVNVLKPQKVFPETSYFSLRIADPVLQFFYIPLFKGVEKGVLKLRIIQMGKLQFYILYMFLTLLVLFIWSFW